MHRNNRGSRLAVGSEKHLVSFFFEENLKRLKNAFIVVYEQESGHGTVAVITRDPTVEACFMPRFAAYVAREASEEPLRAPVFPSCRGAIHAAAGRNKICCSTLK
ncbi:hypothetical protein PSAB6_450145 [Paraburkholderia sabiae]|nr:hypothetical protein PSAB6_450145 [Paraburkholderia sabiae]